MKEIETKNYKESQFNSNIKLLSYDNGFLHALVNGIERWFENVTQEEVDAVRSYLLCWRQKKALELLGKFKECVGTA